MGRILPRVLRRLVPVLFVLTCLLAIATPALAQLVYSATFTVVESNSNDYSMLAMTADVNNAWLASWGFMSSTGLDTRVSIGGVTLPHMLADDKTLFCYPIAADSSNAFQYSMGNTPLTSFYLITGYGGYVTVSDAPALEPDGHFEYEWEGYIDTGAGADKDLRYKQDAFRLYVSGAGNVRAAILSAGDVEEKVCDAAVASGEHKIEVVANGVTMKLYVDSVEEDSVSLAPATVNTSYVSVADNHADSIAQRKTFYAVGRYWVFYSDLTDLSFKTSTDGSSWSAATTIRNCTNDDEFAVWYDNTNVSYIVNNGGSLYYGVGAPQGDGSISWDADGEQTVLTAVVYDPCIAVDTSGYAFISYEDAAHHANFSKNDNNDGTWSTAAGYPYEMYNANNVDGTGIIALSSDRMYGYYWGTGAVRYPCYGQLYTGSWGSNEKILYLDPTQNTLMHVSMSADESDNILVVAQYGAAVSTNEDIIYNYRSYGVGWSFVNGDYLVSNTNMDSFAACAYDANTKLFYAVWGTGTDYIYYATNHNGVWGTPVQWIDETIVDLKASQAVHAPFQSTGGKLFFTYYLNNNAHMAAILDIDNCYVPDNGNDWILHRNDVAPYTEYDKLYIDTVLTTYYQPVTYISGTTLPDRQGAAQNGTITWGSNPAGVAVTLSSTIIGTGSTPTPAPGPRDILPPSSGSDWFGDGTVSGTILTNPVRPLVTALSDNTTLSEIQAWRLYGIIFLVLVFTGVGRLVKGHMGVTVMATSAALGLLVSMDHNIYPVYLLVFVVAGFLGGLVAERSPSL